MPSVEPPGVARLRAVVAAWFKGRAVRSRSARRFAVFAGSGVVVIALVSVWAIHRPLDFGAQTWVIEPGDTLREVATQLVEREVIRHTLPLRIMARVGGVERQIRAGEYRFPPGISLREFLTRMVAGKGQIGTKVTIVEGWTFKQMRAHLGQESKLKHATAAMSDQQIMAALGHPDLHPEGRFFPDTYYYTTGQSDLTVYRKAFHLMGEKLDAVWESRSADALLESKDEALIMASILERESWVSDELPKMAGVFYNRLKKGMRLQTDPTVIYGMGDAYDGKLTRADLKVDTPYNTYTRAGLPPTPISLPDENSLRAATQPVHTKAYYFVAKGGGRHHFSQTLDQHNKAVWKYRKNRGKKN